MYVQKKIQAEKKILAIRTMPVATSKPIESPIDFSHTQIKSLPLAVDYMKLNCQYFSFDKNKQNSESMANTVSTFISESIGSDLGYEASSKAKASAQTQIHSQYSRHDISGTLVMAISCTHKNANILAPLVLDVDKTFTAWNQLYPDDQILPESTSEIKQIANQHIFPSDQNVLHVLSGATYGSSFIGMIHILNTSQTKSHELMLSMAASIQEQAKVDGWLANVSGGLGINSTLSTNLKNMLSSQQITSHCTLSVMGVIPSIKANDVKLAVKGFINDDPAKSMRQLALLQNATSEEFSTIDSAAKNARTGGQTVALQQSKIKGVLSGLSEIDTGNNKIIDTNSLMTAMEDYIYKCSSGSIGVPINYYVKPITKIDIAKLWMAAYYPDRYMPVSDTSNKNIKKSSKKRNK
ncbi:MAG: hypothetical protein GKR88_01815 [Flavobacteriaceae bacterium]|nr:MAG: hypothetical protein GKR88_01815 [Flavobacteriaceae bacterium]